MFGTAGHSVVYQGTASPGLSDASTGKHLFVSFLLFAGLFGPLQPMRRHFPSVWGLKTVDSATGLQEEASRVFSVAPVAPRLWWHDTFWRPWVGGIELFVL